MMATSWNLDEKTPFEEFRTATNTPNNELRWRSRKTEKEFPVFKESKVVERWGGTVAPTDDEIQLFQPSSSIQVWSSTPLSWGMTESPASGRLTASIVGETPFIDPTPYKLSRFN